MLKLLVADDERILREAVCYLIDWKSIGIELAASCKNGREAYEEACRTKPDIILTDIKMPGLSGLELIEKLNDTREKNPGIICSCTQWLKPWDPP